MDLSKIAIHFLPKGAQIPDQTAIVQYVRDFLGSLTKPWLMVVDNMDLPAIFQSVRDIVPASKHGYILYLSRHADSARLGHPMHLTGMAEEEAVELLLAQSRNEPSENNTQNARTIVRELGCCPLAIDQAGSYINSRRLDLGSFIEHYSSRKTAVLKHILKYWEYRKKDSIRGLEITVSAFTTWELTFQQLLGEPDGEDISQILNLAAFLDSYNLCEDLFETAVLGQSPEWSGCATANGAWDTYKFQDLVANLLSLSLIQALEIGPSGVLFSLHPLIRDWIQQRLTPEEREKYCTEAGILLGKTIALQQAQDALVLQLGSRKLLSHVDVWIKNEDNFYPSNAQPYSTDLITSLAYFAAHYEQQGHYTSAELVTRRLIQYHKQWGEADPRYLNAVMNWASASQHVGSLENARNGFKTVALKRTELLGPSNAATLRSMMVWASCESSLQQYMEAEKILRDVLREQTKKLPSSLRDLLETISELGDIYRHTTRLGMAEGCYGKVVVERANILGADHPDTLQALEGLAIVYRKQDRLHEAAALYKYIVNRHESAFGWEHPRTLRTATNHAIAQIHHSMYNEGVDLFDRAVRGFESLLGPNHPDTVWAKQHLIDGKVIQCDRFTQLLAHFGHQEAACIIHQELPEQSFDSLTRVQQHNRLTEVVQPSLPILSSMFDESGVKWMEDAIYKDSGGFNPRWSSSQMRSVRVVIGDIDASNLVDSSALLDRLVSSYGVDVSLEDKWGETQLYRATEAGNLVDIEVLLQRVTIADDSEASDGPSEKDLLFAAICSGKEDVLTRILDIPNIGVDTPGRSGMTPLICAAQKNNLPLLRLLLKTNAVNVNYIVDSNYAFMPATALGYAVSNGNVAMVRLLLDAGALDISSGQTETALITCLKKHLPERSHREQVVADHQEITNLLLSRARPDVNAANKFGWTALHEADTAEMAEAIISRGFRDVNARTHSGITPLFRAKPDVARVLLDHGADQSIANKDGVTPLCNALQMHKFETAKILLAGNNCPVSVPDGKGRTPLYWALRNGNEQIARKLLVAGARIGLDELDTYEFRWGRGVGKETILQMLEEFWPR